VDLSSGRIKIEKVRACMMHLFGFRSSFGFRSVLDWYSVEFGSSRVMGWRFAGGRVFIFGPFCGLGVLARLVEVAQRSCLEFWKVFLNVGAGKPGPCGKIAIFYGSD
jgi:hypothetical protein